MHGDRAVFAVVASSGFLGSTSSRCAPLGNRGPGKAGERGDEEVLTCCPLQSVPPAVDCGRSLRRNGRLNHAGQGYFGRTPLSGTHPLA
jgi:hypothetical protein